jgi:hypothetical protein
MEVDATNTMLPFKKLTDEECAQYHAKGCCFRCRTQGHMACNCPKNANLDCQNSVNIQTNVTATLSVPPSPKLTLTQQIHMLEDEMTEEEHSAYLDA